MFDFRKIPLLLLFLFLYGCAGGGGRIPSPAALTGDPGLRAAYAEGRSLYVRECAACHRRFMPGERTPEEWKEILARHGGKVPLSGIQFGNLEGYLMRASSGRR